VLLGGGQQPDRLLRAGRVGVLAGDRGCLREPGGVLHDPPPPDGIAERALDDGVDLGDGGRLGGPVVDQAAAVAAQPSAAAQPGIQTVQQLGVLLQVADLVIAERGPDRPLDVALVDDARAGTYA
jgi:hypothetical protein